MRYGISYLPDAAPASKPASAYFADVLELARIADDAGLATIKMTEHYLHPYGGYCPSPLAFLAAVAATTRRIRLMTGCILPAFHHPIQIAAESAMVDAISNGRLDVGFARAYLPYEFEAFGVPMDESRDRFAETINTVIRLWTEERVTLQTPFFALRDALVLPRPVQSPHPPVWGAAVRSRQSFAWLGERGFNLLVTPAFSPLSNLQELISIYRESFHSAHPDAASGATVAVSLPLYVADTDDMAYHEGDRHLQHYFDVWADAAAGWDRVHSTDYVGYTGMASAIRGARPEDMRANGNAIIGCPERALDEVHRLTEALDVNLVLWQLDFGAMPLDRSRRSLRWFVEWIMPRLSGGTLASDTSGPELAAPRTSITQPVRGPLSQHVTGMTPY